MKFLRLIIDVSQYMTSDLKPTVHSNSYICGFEFSGSILILNILSDDTRPLVPLELTFIEPGVEVPHPFLHTFLGVIQFDLRIGEGIRHYALLVPKKQLVFLH